MITKKASIFIFFSALLFLFMISCNNNNDVASKYLVTTKVPIKDGEIEEVLQLFKDTNPELVKDQTDWVKAVFSKNEETSTVMVQAYWKSKAAYLAFSKSKKFQETMKRFGKHFKGKPEVEINEILFQM